MTIVKKLRKNMKIPTSLSVYYPFLHYVNTMLIRIGYYGVPAENEKSLVCSNSIFREKLPVTISLKCLNFLLNCGICIDGIGINEKKQNLFDIKFINISYPDNLAILTGLKVMAIAEIDHRTLINQGVFLHCDNQRVVREIKR